MGALRVLVVDDSVFMRKVISEIISSDPQLNVVGTAADGIDALEKIATLKPDVVTLDVNMPRMDGLTTLKHIMEQNPIPVVMLSSATQEGAAITFKALELGAVDYIPKPSGELSLDIGKIRDEIITKIKTAAQAKIASRIKGTRHLIQFREKPREKIITIGASTGGPPAIEEILEQLPKDVPPILIVQHMPVGFTKPFANRLDSLTQFSVKEAEEGDKIIPGQALVAPAGFHMIVTKDKRIHLDLRPPIHGVRPAVDPMMETTAQVYKSQAIGVLLTGMGRDGALGMKAIKNYGGVTIAQNEESCTVFGMPKAAIEEGCVDKVLHISQIAEEIIRQCQQ
ncbi:MAG: chemotaxis response regulator protein-glutamate methylesterase [Candidatus Bathyarchaeia archaeon]